MKSNLISFGKIWATLCITTSYPFSISFYPYGFMEMSLDLNLEKTTVVETVSSCSLYYLMLLKNSLTMIDSCNGSAWDIQQSLVSHFTDTAEALSSRCGQSCNVDQHTSVRTRRWHQWGAGDNLLWGNEAFSCPTAEHLFHFSSVICFRFSVQARERIKHSW